MWTASCAPKQRLGLEGGDVNATTREVWRRSLAEMTDEEREDLLSEEEWDLWLRKIRAWLPNDQTSVYEVLTSDDLLEILLDVIAETRGDSMPPGTE